MVFILACILSFSSLVYSLKANCTYKTLDNICYGHELKEKAFLLGPGFTNLNHGSFGTGKNLIL